MKLSLGVLVSFISNTRCSEPHPPTHIFSAGYMTQYTSVIALPPPLSAANTILNYPELSHLKGLEIGFLIQRSRNLRQMSSFKFVELFSFANVFFNSTMKLYGHTGGSMKTTNEFFLFGMFTCFANLYFLPKKSRKNREENTQKNIFALLPVCECR